MPEPVSMSSFLVILLCLLFGSVANSLILNCSQNQACLGDVIRCQCQDEHTTLLRWRVRVADMRPVEFDMSTNSSVDTNGSYSAILNSTNPFLSQLTITLMEPELTVECEIGASKLHTTIHIIGDTGQPTNLQARVMNPVQNTTSITVMLWWGPLMSATNVIEYRINITELVTGLTWQLNSTNTSVTTQLNTTGEYLVQVVAVNCAGASQGSDPIQFKLTGHMLQIINTSTKGSTGTSGTTTPIAFSTTTNTISSTTAPTTNSTSAAKHSTSTTSTSSAGGHLTWEIGVTGAGIIIALFLTAICVSIVIVVLKRKSKSHQDSTALDQGDRYRHIINRTERNHHQDQEYTLNQLASDNREDDEDDDGLDYCTVRGAQHGPITQPAAVAAAEFSGGYTLIGPNPSYQQIRVNKKDLKTEYAVVRKTTKPIGKLPEQVTPSPEMVPDILTTIVVNYNEESPPQVPPYNAGAATPSASPAETYYDEVGACYDEVGEKMGTPPFPPSPHLHI